MADEFEILKDFYFQKVKISTTHQFPPKERAKLLYHDIENMTKSLTGHFRGWLAVITAEKVLPLFEAKAPNEKAPRRMIHLAKHVCTGTLPIESQRIAVYQNMFYHLSGGGWGFLDEEYVSVAEHFAGLASGKALFEAQGYKLLQMVDFSRQQVVLDTLIPEHSYMDTAGVAAAAYSLVDEVNQKHSSVKMLEFWDWWFNTALNLAREQASKYPVTIVNPAWDKMVATSSPM